MVKKYKYPLGTLLIILALILYKHRFLALPYYWDEAWPYGVAVRTLQANGLSLIPGAIPTFVARGHPLMFHFLAAAWMDVFGTSLIAGHSFALFISILLIIVIFLFGKALFSERVGFIAALLFASQAVFISQSVFLMPEMLLALFAMLSLYAFFKNYSFLFILFATCLILTKESGGVLIITLLLCETIKYLFSKGRKFISLLKHLSIIVLPVCIASYFFIIQKIKFGWFLYPFYMDYIKHDWHSCFDQIANIFAYFFLYYGRNAIAILIIGSVIFLSAYKKAKLSINEKNAIIVLSVFILLFQLFSSINYYIPRYLLCVFPAFLIIAAILIDKVLTAINFRGKEVIYFLLIAGIVISNIYTYVKRSAGGDNDYSPSLITALNVVELCEKENLYDSYIFTTCVMRYDFNEPYAGFTSGQRFKHIEYLFSDKTQYCVFSKDEEDKGLLDQIQRDHHLTLIKRFDDHYAWTELYKVD